MADSGLTAIVQKVIQYMAGGMSEKDAIAKAQKEMPGGQNYSADQISDELPPDPAAPVPLPLNGAGNGGTVISEAAKLRDKNKA